LFSAIVFIAERNIVKEFAHLKWGLFDEDVSLTDEVPFRFYHGNMIISPTRYIDYIT